MTSIVSTASLLAVRNSLSFFEIFHFNFDFFEKVLCLGEKFHFFFKFILGIIEKGALLVLQRVFCIMRDCSWLQGYSRLEEMGSVMNVAIAWNPPSGICIRGHLSACFSNPDKFYRHDCSFFYFEAIWFGIFFCALKKYFFFK